MQAHELDSLVFYTKWHTITGQWMPHWSGHKFHIWWTTAKVAQFPATEIDIIAYSNYKTSLTGHIVATHFYMYFGPSQFELRLWLDTFFDIQNVNVSPGSPSRVSIILCNMDIVLDLR